MFRPCSLDPRSPFSRIASSFSLALLTLGVPRVHAGGPRWVAGTRYFDPATTGRPVVWKKGAVNYFTDQGDLSPTVTQVQANTMVAAAAALWNSVPTAAVQISFAGSLAEDVNGTNFLNGAGGLTMPADVQRTATGTPLGIIYDADGAVIDALEGAGASDPISCNVSGVITLVDNFATDATIAHALMVVNGRCTADAAHVALVQYQLLRGFGRILGLDWSQANDQMFPGHTTPDGLLGWPLMHPVEKLCNSNGNPCMTGTIAPRTDDVAALNRLYPVTSENAPLFPGKLVTATATLSVQGTVYFRTGQGMQGVNVVARPLLPGSDTPDMRYPAAAVSGERFTGDAGNPVTGFLDSAGQALGLFGTVADAFEGWYDLSGIPLPPGTTQADYQLTFEPVNPLYTGIESVGPYALGQTLPSGTMPVVILRGLTAGSQITQDETIADSAGDESSGGDGTEGAPASVPVNGEWLARLSGYGHSSWLQWRLRGGRQATVEAQPVDDRGIGTDGKARIVVGVWNGDDQLGSAPAVKTPQPLNGVPTGLTTLSFQTGNDGDVRIALADQRGDGRPDYLYRGRILYADSVTPQRIPLGGGPIVVDGTGFRPGDTITVGGAAAAVTSISPVEITAIAPISPSGGAGNVDVTVTDGFTGGWATIEGGSGTGLSYDSQSNDELSIASAPANTVPIGVPLPFIVRASGTGGVKSAAGITVTYTVTLGMAALGCGKTTCTAVTTGDGLATITVTANSSALAVVTASLADGAMVTTKFAGASPPSIAAINPTLSLAAGTLFNWRPEAIVLSNGLPYSGQSVTWNAGTGATVSSAATTSDATGTAWTQVISGPLISGGVATVTACLGGTAPGGISCAVFTISAVDPATAALTAVSGTAQRLAPGDALDPIVLRVIGPSSAIAGVEVNFYETLRQWSPPCPAHGSCPIAPVLATQTVQAVSGADGLVTLNPLTDGIVPTRLEVLAVAAGGAALAASVERHP